MTHLETIARKKTQGQTAGPPAGTEALSASRIELVLSSTPGKTKSTITKKGTPVPLESKSGIA